MFYDNVFISLVIYRRHDARNIIYTSKGTSTHGTAEIARRAWDTVAILHSNYSRFHINVIRYPLPRMVAHVRGWRW